VPQLWQQLTAAVLWAGGMDPLCSARDAEAVAHPTNQVARVTAGIPSAEIQDYNGEALLH